MEGEAKARARVERQYRRIPSPLFVPFSMVGQVEMNYGNLYMDFKVNQPMQGNSTEFVFLWIQANNEKYGLAREAVVVAEVEL